MNESPKALRLHIGLFGRRNAGKSSLLNALVGQDVAIVSPTPGSTADPVEKTLEMAPLGPVVFLDTAGLDDRDASLGAQRVERSLRAMRRVDVALLVLDAPCWEAVDADTAARLAAAGIPFYAGADSFVKAGAFATCGVNYTELGTYTAGMAVDILQGGEVPEYHVMEGGIITVNTETAAALGLDAAVFDGMAGTVAEVATQAE